MEVQDTLCPWNAGRHHPHADGESVTCERTRARPAPAADLRRPGCGTPLAAGGGWWAQPAPRHHRPPHRGRRRARPAVEDQAQQRLADRRRRRHRSAARPSHLRRKEAISASAAWPGGEDSW
ncbi:hypothetical protein ACFSKW_04050 [Nonomuraea mangrovi]|uniref:Uncharacterized protein n=1 Tax=Nonomuraea mangrovi TaxID=2316207 RepID=A0ABW4SM63_9ACTN